MQLQELNCKSKLIRPIGRESDKPMDIKYFKHIRCKPLWNLYKEDVVQWVSDITILKSTYPIIHYVSLLLYNCVQISFSTCIMHLCRRVFFFFLNWIGNQNNFRKSITAASYIHFIIKHNSELRRTG
jgi:hypothetical protein